MIMRQVPHLTLEEEKRYVQRAQAGDTTALHKLIEAHYQQMYHLALKVTRDTDASEDVTQEACVQIMRRIDQFRSESRFSSWVSRIIVNTALLKHRKEKRMIPSDEIISKTEADFAPNPEDRMVNIQLLEMTDQVLKQLRRGDRELFIRRFIEGQSLQNISHDTGLSLPALKSRFHRARLKLKSVAHTESWGVEFNDEISLGA